MRLQIPELPCFIPRAKVGDVVYYISSNNRYAVKRATVVEIQRSASEFRQMMSNGDVVAKDAPVPFAVHTLHLQVPDVIERKAIA